ncbi:hypothetical protein DB313_06085 (plasmid) [Borrelia turcica IST7]|uniref:Uncharacterized protein n=1 Tax=Borrelia turcica IST7 TaxID=1104446 RepID=A0A386PRH7_9SPIR|nr:hypothetical protein [Borrelia turcica]AYE37070.1 hypothetical protein DB313_06085 [Borrelia turcica IST7]
METNKKDTEFIKQIINEQLLPINEQFMFLKDIIAKLQKEVNVIPYIDKHIKALNKRLLKNNISLAKQDEKLADFVVKISEFEENVIEIEERVRKRINRGIDKIIAVYSSKYANAEFDK